MFTAGFRSLFLSVATANNYRAEVLADSPSAYWRLGESSGTTAIDEVGSFNGTIVGTPTLGMTGATAGNTAYNFTAAIQRVDTTAGQNYVAGGAWSMEAWLNPSGNDSTVRGAFYSHDSNNAVINGPIMLLLNSSNIVRCLFGGGGSNYIDTTSGIPINTWTYIVATFDANSVLRIYKNAVLESTTIPQTLFPAQSYNLCIGQRRTDSARQFLGGIDEVAIYNTALSATRILAHYNARNL